MTQQHQDQRDNLNKYFIEQGLNRAMTKWRVRNDSAFAQKFEKFRQKQIKESLERFKKLKGE